MTRPILWSDFQPGTALGEFTVVFDEDMAAAWRAIFGAASAGGPAEGASIALAAMMRAYATVVVPRPPGNVHARQQFTLDAAPTQGEAIRTVVSCAAKELKRERRYVDFHVAATGAQGRALYSGILTIVWAA